MKIFISTIHFAAIRERGLTKGLSIMEKSKDKKEDTTVKEIGPHREKKKLLEQVDKNHRDEAEDFLNRFKDDTLTGL